MLNLVLKPHRTSLRAGTAEAQKLFVMLKLIPQHEVARSRPPLAFALVIDTSGSMQEVSGRETKLDRAIQAAHTLLDDKRLKEGDRVTIIHFDDHAKTLLPLTDITRRGTTHDAVEALRGHSGGTHMAKGIRCAVQELGGVPPQTAKRLLLLTDGKTFDEEECRGLARQHRGANIPIIAVGIGEEYNEEIMGDLSTVTQGRPYHLQHMEQLHDILDVEVGSSVREVVTDLQASVSTVRGVQLDSFTRIYPSLADVSLESAPHYLGNIPSGDYTVFVLEFTASGFARPASRVRLSQVGLTGYAPGLNRREELPPVELFVHFTPDEDAVVAVESEVLGYVQQRNVDRMVHDAMQKAPADVDAARQTLEAAHGVTQRIGNAPMTRMIEGAIHELNSTGAISSGTRKTVSIGGRTRTVRVSDGGVASNVPAESDIRRLTGA